VLCLVITPQCCRSEAEVASLQYQFANRSHYDYMIEEDAIVYGPDGEIIARLVTNALDERLIANTAAHFIKVRGDGSARGSIVGSGAMMHRIRKDNTISFTTGVPQSIVKEMVANNEFTDFLGYMDASPRFPACRETAWSLKKPEIHAAAIPFAEAVSRIYSDELPEHYARQREFMERVADHFKLPGSVYTTVTVNRRKRTAYHYDENDFRGGMGNLVVLEGNDSGELVMPRFRLAFRPRPTDVLLMDVHQMHGNLQVVGERLTAVLYAREHIDECGG